MAYKKGSLKQGTYIPRNPDKCVITEQANFDGKKNYYRSGWERKFMQWADMNPAVVRWSSEPFSIPYYSEAKAAECMASGRPYKGSNYHIDFYIETINGEEFLVEVKPYSETLPPKEPKKKTEKSMMNHNKAIQTYLINQDKWKAARAFAESKNIKFIIITEKELGI